MVRPGMAAEEEDKLGFEMECASLECRCLVQAILNSCIAQAPYLSEYQVMFTFELY